MVLPFDQLIAADSAKLSLRFVKMGLVPELASSHFVVARCGFGAASWLALSGTTILDWSHGTGPEVTGPAMPLLLAITGRSAGLGDLAGAGLATLQSRMPAPS